MKKLQIYALSAAIVCGSVLSGCTYSGYESYAGTMVGAQIGSVIGESIGWLSTSRHGGPGTAMLGSVIGTAVGAVIGNSIGNEAAESKRQERAERKQRQRAERANRVARQEETDNYDFSGIQTEGGRDASVAAINNNSLVISNLHYEDEDGDGKMSKYETVNVIYEVHNPNSYPVDANLITGDNNPNLEFSPVTNTRIEAGKSIRYKAKVFCKKVPDGNYTEIPLAVSGEGIETSSATIRIKNGK